MDEKLRFVFEYERDEEPMKALCARFGVSRETGYVWLRRYRQYGLPGLVDVNRAPERHPNQTAALIEAAVLGLRQAHMTWGPRKLKRILERDQPGRGWPATSTMGEIVKRAGLVVERKKRRKTEPYTEPLAHAVESNQVWCADFKGWFRSGDGTRIDPLKLDLRPAQDWRAQQRELDRFRHDYNHVRPHEALGMQTPASVYEPSPRTYPERVPEVEYPDTMLVRTVKSHGHFRWKKHDVFLSEVLWGERVGLLPVDDGIYAVYFAHMPLGMFSERLLRVMPLNKKKGASGLSFLRHERSIVRSEFEAGLGANQAAVPLPTPHRLDESQPVIPQRVALPQSPPPLHQPVSCSTLPTGNVNRNCVVENENLSGMCPV